MWYPAAGRLSVDGGGCKLNIRCNHGGAIMVEAVASGVKLSELGDLTQYNEFYETLVYKPFFDGDFSVMPLVVAQVSLSLKFRYETPEKWVCFILVNV